MLKLNPSQQRQPIGGHHFPSHGTTFKATTFSALVSKVRQFRVMNGLTVGDPEQEVLRFYGENWPFMVKEAQGVQRIDGEDYANWRESIQRLWKKPPLKQFPAKLAQPRWEICVNCPHNKLFPWETTDESIALTRRAFLLRRGVPVPFNLGYCAHHRCDLSVLVFCDPAKDASAKKDGEDPPQCWVASSGSLEGRKSAGG